MASNPLFWQDGFGGGASTAPIAFADDIYVYGDAGTSVFFVDSQTGSNSNAGTRTAPFATFAYAASQAGAGDVLVILSGHSESLTTNLTIAVRIIVIGEGLGTARPAIYTTGGRLILTAPCHVHGVRFPAAAGPSSLLSASITTTATDGCRFAYCHFEAGQYEATATKLSMADTAGVLDNCTFSSAATSVATRPKSAFTGARLVRNCTIDGGVYGWKSPATMLFGWGNTASGPVGLAGTSSVSVIQAELSDGAYFDVTTTPDYHIYTEGLGLVGHPLIAGEGLFVSGDAANVHYVNSATGTDSGSAGWGSSYKRPYATLKYAVNTVNALGLIVVAAGHTETTTSARIIADAGGVIIVGEGSGTNRPAITRNYDGIGFDLAAAAGVGLCNLQFPQSGTSSASARTQISSVGAFIHQCAFDCGANDILGIQGDADDFLLDACVFTSTATSNATVAQYALDASAVANMTILGCTFDGGAYGWNSGICAAPSALSLYVDNLTLIRDAIFVIEPQSYAVTVDAFIQVELATGTSGILSRPIV